MKFIKLSILLCIAMTTQAKEIIRRLDNSRCFFKYDDKNPNQGSVACADHFKPASVICGGNKPYGIKTKGTFANPAFVTHESGANDLCYVYPAGEPTQFLTKRPKK
jgi:hypothetical protein